MPKYKRGLEDVERVVEEHKKQESEKIRKEKSMLKDPRDRKEPDPDLEEQDTDEF